MLDIVEAATRARANAYAPYSVYRVGAAVLGADGRVYTGCNVENVSYGLSVCAERTAIVKMVSEGCRELKAAAVVTADGGTPCGMCLQTLLEFSPDPDSVKIWCVGENGKETDWILSELLPRGFRPELKKQ
jgi:cytidine deaminase